MKFLKQLSLVIFLALTLTFTGVAGTFDVTQGSKPPEKPKEKEKDPPKRDKEEKKDDKKEKPRKPDN